MVYNEKYYSRYKTRTKSVWKYLAYNSNLLSEQPTDTLQVSRDPARLLRRTDGL